MRHKEKVAILGASNRPDRYAFLAQKMLMKEGHEVFPVSLREDKILELPTFPDLSAIPEPIDTLTLYVGGPRLDSLLNDMLQLAPHRVIFNPGTENDAVENALAKAGIETERACTLVLLRTGQF